jgi:Concanavalin A-like lectin/glucanases superfamily
MKFKNQIRYLTHAIVFGLSLALVVSSCSKKSSPFVPPSTSALSAAIDSAQWYLTNTHEGTQPGEYTKGTQATLQTAVTAAQAVLTAAATTGTQAEVTAATENLLQALAAYEAGLITPIAGSSLVAYWKFNGNANDSSGNGHNGTLEACPPAQGGVGLITTTGVQPGPAPNLTIDRFGNANSAYHFSNGGNIDVPYSPAFNPAAISISLWCRQDTAGRIDGAANCYLISLSRWNGWKFQTQPDRPFFTYQLDSTVAGTYFNQDANVAMTIGTTVGAGPWNHLVVTYDGVGTETFYINGVPTHTWTNPAVRGAMMPINPTYDLAIGTDLTNSAYSYLSTAPNYISYGGYWTGDMDDVMIYNIALTASQVTQIYNQQVTQ